LLCDPPGLIVIVIIIIIIIIIITQSVLRQVNSLFQREFSTERDLVLPVSSSSIFFFFKVIQQLLTLSSSSSRPLYFAFNNVF
jgi:hypothetical protein